MLNPVVVTGPLPPPPLLPPATDVNTEADANDSLRVTVDTMTSIELLTPGGEFEHWRVVGIVISYLHRPK